MAETSDLRLTLAQINPTVGDVSGNAKMMLDIWQANDQASDIVIFPEMCLSGYQIEDLAQNFAFHIDIQAQINNFLDASENLGAAAIIPCPWVFETGIYNSFLLIHAGEILAIQKKAMLPNYGVFDEKRNYQADDLPDPIQFKGFKLGLLICEDMWYADVPQHLIDNGAEILIAINGSPYDAHKQADRLAIARACTDLTGLDLIYLNLIGGQDDIVFDGASFVLDRNGDIQYQAQAFKDAFFHVTLEKKGKSLNLDIKGAASKPQKTADYIRDHYQAVTLGLRDYVRKNGFKKVLIGLSGGADSALVAAIAVDAVGAENVRTIMLPSEFTSPESLEDAKNCAALLGVQYDIIPITEALKSFENIIPSLKGLAHENTQSRIRGLILMAISNISGEILLSTGNKSELATGYATLYGDMNGGYNPLKDLYKTEVYKLCAYRNEVSHVIPDRILTKAPSAELRPDQTDQDSLPPYDLLDSILYTLIELEPVFWDEEQDPADLVHIERALAHPKEVENVAKLLRNSEFKRFQSCPGPRVSNRAFHKDRRYPITNKFLNRIEKP